MGLFGFLGGEVKPSPKDVGIIPDMATHPSQSDLKTMAAHPDFSKEPAARSLDAKLGLIDKSSSNSPYDPYAPENNPNVQARMDTIEAAQEITKHLETTPTKTPGIFEGNLRRALSASGTNHLQTAIDNRQSQTTQQVT